MPTELPPNPVIEMIDPMAITPADALAVAELSFLTWPSDAASPEARAAGIMARKAKGEFPVGHERWIIVRSRRPGQLLSKAEVFPRRIRTPAGELTILALAGVCSRPEVRGKGLGSLVVRRAFALVDGRRYCHCVYQTTPPRQALYERLGARRIHNRFVNSLAADPKANAFWDELAMCYSVNAAWPEGEIDLLGPGY